MTVPGKGGRPRKWRSDTDRQRAWRARQAGGDEPLTLVQAFDDGDELARVWQLVRHQQRPNRSDLVGRVNGWKQILNALTIHYGERITASY